MTQLKEGGCQPRDWEEHLSSASTVIARWQGMAGTSRVNREVYARFCGRLEVKSLRPTRQSASQAQRFLSAHAMRSDLCEREPWPTDWSLGFVDAAARWLVRVDKSGQRRGECLAFVWAEPPIFCGISVPSTDRSSRSYRLKSSSRGSEKRLRAKSSLSRST